MTDINLDLKQLQPPEGDSLVLLRVLAHPTRVSILKTVSENQGRCTAANLADTLGESRMAINKHLKVLEEANLISNNRGINHASRFNQRFLSVNVERIMIQLDLRTVTDD